jgi:hypothetical protein
MRNYLTNYILLTVEVRDFDFRDRDPKKSGYEDLLSLLLTFYFSTFFISFLGFIPLSLTWCDFIYRGTCTGGTSRKGND